MMLTWQDVAGGLPQPDMPMPQHGWATRFFSTVLVVRTASDRRALESAARRLREGGCVLALRDPNGNSTPCRLVGMEGLGRVVLEFEVLDGMAV